MHWIVVEAVFGSLAKRMIKSAQPPYPARWGINHSRMWVKKHYITTFSFSIKYLDSVKRQNAPTCKILLLGLEIKRSMGLLIYFCELMSIIR